MTMEPNIGISENNDTRLQRASPGFWPIPLHYASNVGIAHLRECQVFHRSLGS
jgi:hypothetical protein